MNVFPPRPAGQSRFALYVQAVWDILWGSESIFVPTPGGPLRFEKLSTGKYRPILKPVGGGAGTNIKMYELQDILDNVLLCYPLEIDEDGVRTTTTDYVFIAKPPELSQLVLQEVLMGEVVNYTYTDEQSRTATLDADPLVTENQVIVPRYLLADEDNYGSIIFAAKLPGVWGTVDIVDVGEVQLTEQDLNVGGRAWSLKNEEA